MEHNNTKEQNMEMDFDFDLPEVAGAPAAKPRIHQAPGESVCISCEG